MWVRSSSGPIAVITGASELDWSKHRDTESVQARNEPPARPPVPSAQEEVTSAGPSQAECILVVDDEAENRNLLTRVLSQEGYQYVTASNGLEALQLIKQRDFDVILLDVMMPEMDGSQLLGHLKADAALKHIPVIIVSGFTDLERTAQCIKMGAEDYLPKPFNSTLLLARVTSCLEKKRLRDKEQQMYRSLLASQEELAGELKEAADHVRNLLPPRLVGDLRTDWRFIPSKHLGGDAFGYFSLDKEHFVTFLLDVCGHGISAALLSISVMNTLRSQALPATDFRDPAAVMASLNSRFKMADHNNMYFTIWYGVYHRASRQLTYTSAGHPPAVLLRKEAGQVDWLKKLNTGGPLVGMLPDTRFSNAQIDVPPGSQLFIFSDGTYELSKQDGTILSLDEFLEVLADPSASAAAELDRIVQVATSIQGSDAFEDDFSILQVCF